MNPAVKQAATTLAGAVVGAILGYLAFLWLARNYGAIGFAIPGVMTSLGAGFGRCPWKTVAIICGLIGFFAGLFSAWKMAPFIADRSFGYFVTHFYQIQSISLVLIIAGGLIAFWIPFRRCPPKALK